MTLAELSFVRHLMFDVLNSLHVRTLFCLFRLFALFLFILFSSFCLLHIFYSFDQYIYIYSPVLWHFVRSICALLYLLCLLRLFWCISVIIYIHIFHSLLLDDLFVLSIWFILICLNYCLNNSINFLSYIFVSLCNLFCPVPQSHNLNFNQRRAWWRRLATNLNNPQVDRTVFTVDIWVCLKIVYPFLPNGFADHYPYFLWLFHWEYSLFSSPNPYTVDCF